MSEKTFAATCPKCSAGLRVAERKAGSTAKCPGCGIPFVVPYPDTIEFAPVHVPEVRYVPHTEVVVSPHSKRWIKGLSAALTATVAAFAAYAFWPETDRVLSDLSPGRRNRLTREAISESKDFVREHLKNPDTALTTEVTTRIAPDDQFAPFLTVLVTGTVTAENGLGEAASEPFGAVMIFDIERETWTPGYLLLNGEEMYSQPNLVGHMERVLDQLAPK